MVKNYDVTGMTCSACSSGIERAVLRLNGVNSVEVSLMGKSMRLDFDEAVLSEDDLFNTVLSLGYGIYEEGGAPADTDKREDKKMFLRFIISVCLLIPLMYIAMGHMINLPMPTIFSAHHGTSRWSALVQAIISAAIIGVNYKYFSRGFMALIKKSPNMDTLVSLGSGVSFIYSLVLTVLLFFNITVGESHLYFESAAMILTLVDVGKWLEEKSKRRTGGEIEKLLRLAPEDVSVEVDGEVKIVPSRSVRAGDVVIVKQGDYVPVDGVIVEGSAFLDKSAITGESMPVEVTVGDAVTTASLSCGGYIKVRAERVGGQTTLAQIIKMVRQAGASKAPIQKFADKVAGVFVPAVTAIALITFAIWLMIDRAFVPDHCITYSISVLVVSCPCALGLATPVAIMTSTGKAASFGVLYKDAEAIQRICDINCVLLDKTATITEGKPQVSDFIVCSGNEETARRVAGAVERNSNHPLAKCIAEYCTSCADATNYVYTVGKGAQAEVDGTAYRIGNLSLISDIKISAERKRQAEELASCGKTVVYLAGGGELIAIIAITDAIKDTSAEAISLLKGRDIKLAMLTGDGESAARSVAQSVGLDDFVYGVLPDDKLRYVENLQKSGGTVAMVGDGINDSPALKKADVGVAIGSGTDVAIDSADVILVGGDLRALDTAIDLGKATVRNIKQNLFWAFFYNVVMIPIAAGALSAVGFTFNPMLAALCMSLSSLFVVCNALRLLLYKNKRITKRADAAPPPAPESEEKDLNSKNISEDNSMKKIVNIQGMCCEHCAARVEKALSAVSGVVSADVKLKKNIAIVRSREEVPDEEIKKVVEEAGYTVTSIENK